MRFWIFILCAPVASPTTFYKDVLPILQKNCQSCHRTGEVAPMPFLTYEQTRPWAKAIKEAVATKKMPPWFAQSGHRKFANERTLSPAAIDTLIEWANTGATEGNPKDAPTAPKFADGWNIRPDIVVEMPNSFDVPAAGTIDYRFVLVKAHFDHDVWVQAAEIRPGNREVVHHMKAWIKPPDSTFMEGAEPGEFLTMEMMPRFRPRFDSSEILAKYNPGLEAQAFAIDGAAKFIPKGSDIVFECHYTASGTAVTDKSKVGIMLAEAPPKRRFHTTGALSNGYFTIPPMDPNAEVRSAVELLDNVELVWIQPHMHVRGKDYELRAIYPTGEKETLLKAKFDFNWQLGYEFARPVVLPKGTRLEGISHFDNSPNNPSNPDPKAEVHYGEQSWEEMSVGFFSVIMDVNKNPSGLFRRIPQPN